jgi:hypothetical protein
MEAGNATVHQQRIRKGSFEMELTRFRGHPNVCFGGVYDV